MAKRKTAVAGGIRKKSVSKAPAARGREDSRAAQIKNEMNAKSIRAHKDPAKLAEWYNEREHDVDRERKTERREKHKVKDHRQTKK
jgi:hypothetical protein